MPGMGPISGSGNDPIRALLGVIGDPKAYQARLDELDKIEARIGERQKELAGQESRALAMDAKAKEGVRELGKAQERANEEWAGKREELEARGRELAGREEKLKEKLAEAERMVVLGREAEARGNAARAEFEVKNRDVITERGELEARRKELDERKKALVEGERTLGEKMAKVSAAAKAIAGI